MKTPGFRDGALATWCSVLAIAAGGIAMKEGPAFIDADGEGGPVAGLTEACFLPSGEEGIPSPTPVIIGPGENGPAPLDRSAAMLFLLSSKLFGGRQGIDGLDGPA